MKRLSFCLAILLTLSFGLAYAQAPGNTFIRLGTVTVNPGVVTADTIFFNGTAVVTFPMVYGNRDANSYNLSNAFRISSPDGATWAHAAGNGGNVDMTGPAATMPGIWVDTVGFIHKDMYDLVFKFNLWGADGAGVDTFMFSGSIGPSLGPGMPVRDSGTFYNVLISAKIADTGKHICIDSSTNYPPTGAWKWPAIYVTPAYNTFPTWSGLKCFILEKARNFAPVITNCVPSITGSHCGALSKDFDATDAEQNAIVWSIVSGVGSIVPSTGVYTVNGLAAGTYNVVVGATDPSGSGQTTTCAFDVVATNAGPAITCPSATVTISAGDTKSQTATATDDCDPLTWFIVANPMVGAVTLGPAGKVTYTADPADAGTKCITVGVTDGLDTAQCDVCFLVLLGCPYKLTIDKKHDVLQGLYTNVDITLSKIDPAEGLGGFDLLIAYDNSALSFIAATAGTIYTECGWEYFTYRYGANGNCSGGCPSGLIRVVGIAETNNGGVHPTCLTPKYVGPLPTTLASLQFLVTNNRTLECQFVPIRFFWVDCGDNTLSNASGSKLFTSCKVFDFDNANPINADGPLPTYMGAPNACITSGGPNKPAVERGVDFQNGGIDIVCADSIDARGDVNQNALAYEIADAVMFTNYFIYGLSAFGTNYMQVQGSIAATDVNADGITLSVADLVYLIRVIVGDALPYPKPTNLTATVGTYDSKVTITGSELGAVFMVLKGEVTPTLIANAKMEYAYDGANTRVLVHVPYDLNQYGMAIKGFSGDILNTTGAELVSIEMADVHGYKLDQALPSDYSLLQNYPNPFNPSTKISFDMPKAGAYKVTVYNVTGQKVAEFAGDAAAGRQTITWDASVNASGVYFYKLETAGFTATKKAVLLK